MQNASFAVFGFGFSDISSFRVPELCDLITNDRVGAGVMDHDESKLSVEETMRDGFDVGDVNETHEYPSASRHRKKFAAVDDVMLLQVLQDIVSQIDDWNERRSEEKSLKDIKSSALLKLGEVMKRLAMDELMDDDTNVDADDDYNDEISTTTDGSSNLVRGLK
ncbi:hypothetical protein AeRB84_005503 [Aphanomyces euteiches]|nr:hypothetical protein AeRB84_005503 [Aphanomyces euteiches]